MLIVAIVGGSGYTGLELLRILAAHPGVKVVEITSRQYKEKAVASVFPHLKGFYDGLIFSGPEKFKNLKAGLVFCALPHGASQEVVPVLLESGKKVIDLSADFRIKDADIYEEWYEEHTAKNLLKKAVYGLPELSRVAIKKAKLVANPGCYPTGAILALYPLVKAGLVKPDSIVIDSKSGTSGAGRQASVETSFVEVAGAFKAYKIGSHRHTPEIEQMLTIAAKEKMSVAFTPHLLPVSRGILTTAYASLTKAMSAHDVHALYAKFYKGEFFVRIMDEGRFPDIAGVRGSNFCDIGVYADPKTKRVIIISAIDNLVKGASGQAVQNMNIMAGFEETTGLKNVPMAY
ncbi:MAG: N-acetyl-gamma-glutamyl-phosphate reductase [Deltaproteobacteria bacterium]|nr:N-acetyl-gamma-glutamyl-phosphate reductase [Deltaproteobacteria bacterium]